MRKVLSNTISLVASDVFTRITSFVIYILVGRYLGAFAFGQMSLALSMFYTFQVLSVAGLKVLIVREVAKDPNQAEKYFVNGSFFVIVSSLISLGILALLVYSMGYHHQYPPQEIGQVFNYQQPNTAIVILLTCLSLVPFAMSRICEGIFQGTQNMTFIAYVGVPVNLIRIILIIGFLTNGYGLYTVIFILLFTHIFAMLAMWVLLWVNILRPKLRLDFSFMKMMFRQALTFLGIDAVVAVTSSIYLIILSYFLDETAVGLYSSAAQLVTPFFVISQSIIVSTFPILCGYFEEDNMFDMRRVAHNLLEILLVIFFPTVVLVFYHAEWSLDFIFGGAEFAEAGDLLRIMVIAMMLRSLTSVLGGVLLASLREKITFRIVIVELVLNLLLGVTFMYFYGLVGAASASLVVMIVVFLLHLFPVLRIIKGISILSLIWRVLLAAIVMAAFLNLKVFTYPLIDMLSAGLLYLLILAILVFLSFGSIQKMRSHYLG